MNTAAFWLSIAAIVVSALAVWYTRRQAHATEKATKIAADKLELDRQRAAQDAADREPKLWVTFAPNTARGGGADAWSAVARVHNDGGSHAPRVEVSVRLSQPPEGDHPRHVQIGGSREPQDVPAKSYVDFPVVVYQPGMYGGAGGIDQAVSDGRITLHAFDAATRESA